MHVRTQIRNLAVTLLTGLPTCGARVFKGRAYPLGVADTPGLIVTTDAEPVTPQTMNSPRKLERVLQLVVRAVAVGDTAEDTLDQMCLEVEEALAVDAFSAVALDCVLTVTRVSLSGLGETPASEAEMTFDVTYWTAENAPDVALV